MNLLADATGTRRVRLRTEGEVTENLASARLSVRWRRFHLDSRMDQIKVVGGDLPTDTRLLRSGLRWRVRRWLIVDGLVQRETRDTVGIEGTFDFEEVGVTLQYALFSFYARVRQQEFADAGNPTRRDRRAWVGIERVFNFGFGERFR